jgi:hypothetical protein
MSKEEKENSDRYIYKIHCKSQNILEELIFYKKSSTETLQKRVLKWLAETLDSDGAVLLSWPGKDKKMEIQEQFTETSGLKSCIFLNCFERLREKLSSDNPDSDPLILDETSGICELQINDIKSLIAFKIITDEGEFKGKQVLMVCNRKKLALRGGSYVGFDFHYCYIAIWILKLHLSELYKLKSKGYQDALKRYKDTKIASSLQLLGETSHELLDLFKEYHAIPPLSLLYDCLDSSISLFNAGEKEPNELKKILKECEANFSQMNYNNNEIDSYFVRHALARGYFALGIKNKDYWEEGTKLLD